MATSGAIPVIMILMLAMTGTVTLDSYNRNKYASSWFFLVSISGIIGVLFYYVTVRTEEQSELPSPASTGTRVMLMFLTIIGAFCIFATMIAIIGSPSTGGILMLFLYGIPSIAISFVLYCDYSHGELEKQRVFSESLYVFSFSSILSFLLFPRDFASQFVSYHAGTGITILIAAVFPIIWYLFRKKEKVRSSVRGS